MAWKSKFKALANNFADKVKQSARGAVSQDKKRFQKDGFDLDLSYITPQLIAMAMPGDRVNAAWRNDISEVALFLNRYHKDHYRVFNLMEKVSYNRQRLGHNTVVRLGWLDHHAPPFATLLQILQQIDDWLKQSDDNVAVIHCKAGRGRTGTVVASYLVYAGICRTAHHAIERFGQARSNTGASVQVPSQKRYVEYVEQMMKGLVANPTAPTKVKLLRILMKPVPRPEITRGSMAPSVEVFQISSADPTQPKLVATLEPGTQFRAEHQLVRIDANIPIQGDIMLKVFNNRRLMGIKLLCRTQFSTAFVGNQRFIDLRPHDIDASSQGTLVGEKGIPSNFVLRLMFAPHDQLPPQSQPRNI